MFNGKINLLRNESEELTGDEEVGGRLPLVQTCKASRLMYRITPDLLGLMIAAESL